MSTSSQPPAVQDRDIWVDLTVPAPIMGIDVFSSVTGLNLDALLAGALRSPAFDRDGQRYYPLRLQAGDNGFVFKLRTFGALGFKAHRGRVAIYLPPSFQEAWEKKVPLEVRGHAAPGRVGSSPAFGYLLNLSPGAAAGLDLPLVGTLGIRMALSQPGPSATG